MNLKQIIKVFLNRILSHPNLLISELATHTILGNYKDREKKYILLQNMYMSIYYIDKM